MSTERNPSTLTADELKSLETANLNWPEFTFPAIDLSVQTLPHIKPEIAWLRKHVEEGSIDKQTLILEGKTVHIDLQPCPDFLMPYIDSNLLSSLLRDLRRNSGIPRKLTWGTETEILHPEKSRLGLSVEEINQLVIPSLAEKLEIDQRIRLPKAAEYLYLKSQGLVFDDKDDVNYELATKEWTDDLYYPQAERTNPLGNLIVFQKSDIASRSIHWWTSKGSFNRLPTLGFRLVIESE